jgi:hypothetical protein
MGRRSATESVVAIFAALMQKRTWRQAELARHVGITVPAVRKCLLELKAHHVPLEQEHEHPDIMWSVPRTWAPGGIALDGDDLGDLLRLLARAPRSAARERLRARIAESVLARPKPTDAILTGALEADDAIVSTIEDAATRSVALRFTYFTVSRGKLESRVASVHRVLVGPPVRFVAVCTRSGVPTLKWFRAENVTRASLDPQLPFLPAPSDVDAFIATSVDGFRAGEVERSVFFVRDPEANWVERNLIVPMTAERVPGGVRVTCEAAATVRVARYVVGLGEAATAQSAALAAMVADLARGALEGARPKRLRRQA